MYKLLTTCWLCLVLSWGVVPAHGEVLSAKAREIQAAFLVRFSSYVKWPENIFSDRDAPVVIWIIGKDPFGSSIDTIARSFTANGRQVEIRRCVTLEDAGKGNIYFITQALVKEMSIPGRTVRKRRVLLVGNSQGFLHNGGMINFIKVGSKIRFDISATNCTNAGLGMSSKLLKVARIVY